MNESSCVGPSRYTIESTIGGNLPLNFHRRLAGPPSSTLISPTYLCIIFHKIHYWGNIYKAEYNTNRRQNHNCLFFINYYSCSCYKFDQKNVCTKPTTVCLGSSDPPGPSRKKYSIYLHQKMMFTPLLTIL